MSKNRDSWGEGMGPGYVVIMTDAECGQISPDVYREAPIDLSDPDAVKARNELRDAIFAAFFGTAAERERYGTKCFPFNELPPRAVELMDSNTRAAYLRELDVARDPRSGRIMRPYIPQDAKEDTQL